MLVTLSARTKQKRTKLVYKPIRSGEMAEASFSSALLKIGNLLIEEAKFLYGVGDQVEQLQKELDGMLSPVRGADSGKDDDEIIEEWISQTINHAYEADDLAESYAFKVASRGGDILKRFDGIPNECYARYSIGAQIQKLRTKISALNKKFQDRGVTLITERESSISTDLQLRQAYARLNGKEIHDFTGFEGDVELLVEQLVIGNDVYRDGVMSIYGIGGLGKAALV